MSYLKLGMTISIQKEACIGFVILVPVLFFCYVDSGGSKWSSGNTFAWQGPGRGFESCYCQKRKKTHIRQTPAQKVPQLCGRISVEDRRCKAELDL